MHALFARVAGMAWAIKPEAQRAFTAVARALFSGASADERRLRVQTDAFGKRAVNRVRVGSAMAGARGPGGETELGCGVEVVQRIALIDVSGVLMRSVADVTDSNGERFGSAYDEIAANAEWGLASPGVDGAMLLIDSPGGLATPCRDTFNRIRSAAEASGKPVWAVGLDECCSAALYLAAAADRFLVLPTGMVGNIGTIIPFIDWSEQLKQEGGKSELIVSAGSEAKVDGYPLEPFSDAERARLQAMADHLGEDFRAALMQGREVSAEKVQQWASMGAWFGEQAVAMGLADEVVNSIGEAVAAMSKSISAARVGGAAAGGANTSPPSRRSRMDRNGVIAALGPGGVDMVAALEAEAVSAFKSSPEYKALAATTRPASLAELKGAFDDPAFVLACLEGEMSLSAAKAKQAESLGAELAKARAELAQAKAQLADDKAKREEIVASLKAAKVSAGTKPVEHEEAKGGAGDAAAQWWAAVGEIQTARKISRSEAIKAAVAEKPELHKAYLASTRKGE